MTLWLLFLALPKKRNYLKGTIKLLLVCTPPAYKIRLQCLVELASRANKDSQISIELYIGSPVRMILVGAGLRSILLKNLRRNLQVLQLKFDHKDIGRSRLDFLQCMQYFLHDQHIVIARWLFRRSE